MKSLRKQKQEILNLFEGLVFDSKKHTYRFDNDSLANVSSFVSRLSDPFDPKMAERVANSKGAKGYPSNPDYYTQRWKLLGNESTARGSRVHLYAEQYPTLDIPADTLEEGVVNFYDWMEEEGYEVVVMELRMTDGKLAGTCDLLLRHRESGKFVIADWKTNAKDISKIERYHKPLKVFTDVLSNDEGKYTVQVNLYKYMLEEKGIEIDELWLIHLSESYESLYKVIKVPVLKDINKLIQTEGEELKSILDDFRQELEDKRKARQAKWNKKNK